MRVDETLNNFNIYHQLIGTTNAVQLTFLPGDEMFPVYSPDGQRIAFTYRTDEDDHGI